MKVLHLPFGYYPDAVGGTEVYVAELARGLEAHGVESAVAAPSADWRADEYQHDGVHVHRFSLGECRDVADLYGDGDEAAARAIAAIIDDIGADVLHLHAFTRAASLRAARLAKQRGVAVAFTYHTPTASCVRGTLLRDGREPCDGALVAQRCAACLLESRGMPHAVREAVSRAPDALGAAFASMGWNGSLTTALRARELTGLRHRAFGELLRVCDSVVAVCEWVRALLLRAGAPAERLVLSRQGTPARPVQRPDRQASNGQLRMAFVGRLHPTKGVHVIVGALAQDRDLPVTLDVFGVEQDSDAVRYRSELEAMARNDTRIRFNAPLDANHVVETLATYDATVVPSQWLETGPLTVLESFAAGVPVIGSNLGGIAELVTHDRDGWLVPYADLGAWATALRRIAADRALLARLRAGVTPPRSTDDVARDMATMYHSLAQRPARHTANTAGVA
jgi:glycosyltransferase involved in cell wall biosynthesis